MTKLFCCKERKLKKKKKENEGKTGKNIKGDENCSRKEQTKLLDMEAGKEFGNRLKDSLIFHQER